MGADDCYCTVPLPGCEFSKNPQETTIDFDVQLGNYTFRYSMGINLFFAVHF